MTSFNSLGSNYTVDFIIKALFTLNRSQYQEELALYLEKKYQGKATLVYKGREALEMALTMLDFPARSKVIINGFTCYAVYRAVENAGLDAICADIDKTFNFSASTLENLIKKHPTTQVVIVQNTFGFPCDIEKIASICKQHKLILIEDLAHCIGTRYSDNQESGTVGDFTTLSFSQDKMIDGVSGGALVIRNKKYNQKNITLQQNVSYVQQIKDRLYPLLTFIIRKTYQTGIGKTFHMFLKQFGLLSTPMAGGEKGQFRKLPNWHCKLIKGEFEKLYTNLSHRRETAMIYAGSLNKNLIKDLSYNLLPNSSNLRFITQTKDIQSLFKYLKKSGIYIADTWYDAPIAPIKYLKETRYKKGDCSNAEVISETIINLPTHRAISQNATHRIVSKINAWQQLQQKT